MNIHRRRISASGAGGRGGGGKMGAALRVNKAQSDRVHPTKEEWRGEAGEPGLAFTTVAWLLIYRSTTRNNSAKPAQCSHFFGFVPLCGFHYSVCQRMHSGSLVL